MKKILRYSILSMLAMVSTTAFAEEKTVVIDFNAMTDLPMSWSKSDTEEASNAGDITEEKTITVDGVTIVISPKEESNKNANRFWRTSNGPQLRCYSGTLKMTAGEKITGVEFDAPSKWDMSATPGTCASKVWGGEATEIMFTFNANTQINKITVKLGGQGQEVVSIANTPETAYTVAKAHEIIEAGQDLGTKIYVKGIVVRIDDISTEDHPSTDKEGNSVVYGNATYWISDDGNDNNPLEVYRGYGLNGDHFASVNQLLAGDEVIVYGKVKDYVKGDTHTHEFDTGSQIYSSSNASLTNINAISADTDANAPAYNVAGQRVNSSYKGVVVKNGKKFIK